MYGALNNDLLGLSSYFSAAQTADSLWAGIGLEHDQSVDCFFNFSM